MEQLEPQAEYSRKERIDDLTAVFGNDGMSRLMSQISHDNPALTEEEVIEHAWSLISEATAYALPATQETLTKSAINIHEGYEAFRRVQS